MDDRPAEAKLDGLPSLCTTVEAARVLGCSRTYLNRRFREQLEPRRIGRDYLLSTRAVYLLASRRRANPPRNGRPPRSGHVNVG